MYARTHRHGGGTRHTEVLRRKYTKACDIWSLGVILYIMLSGRPPFWGDNERATFRSVLNDPVDFSRSPWPSVSEAAKDLVRKMLNKDPDARITVEEVSPPSCFSNC